MKITKENISNSPKFRKQLKTVSIDVPICPCCGQDLYIHELENSEKKFECRTKDCGYSWEDKTV